jgi:hypothetical protein
MEDPAMVKVHHTTTDSVTAWHIRDRLASHPLLGGATAQISVIASHEDIVLDGWALDERVIQLALKLARRAAGHRAVKHKLCTQHTQGPSALMDAARR